MGVVMCKDVVRLCIRFAIILTPKSCGVSTDCLLCGEMTAGSLLGRNYN
jgi:hypothetical protein